jgi:hypothetical protein
VIRLAATPGELTAAEAAPTEVAPSGVTMLDAPMPGVPMAVPTGRRSVA